ncbi:TetR family transcriptional regulator [Nocardia sp. NPDC024068]|uniref:TetR/AcrR family transcriptional regulator n=1 Tax=Nocardia sp. NPDC024068 TaxID=3157197 RepID=UPI0033E6C3FB
MPRGVAIPEVRQQLFAAVERVIVRDGPSRLSGRAVTAEAGVATGLLYAHFADLEDFLAGYAVDRAFLISAGVAGLPERAGMGDIATNVCDAVLSTPPRLRAFVRLLVARPELAEKVHAVLGDETAGLEAIEVAVTAYLAAEQQLGRLGAAADPELLSLALVGTFHHLVLTSRPETDIRARMRRAVAGLIACCVPAGPAEPPARADSR